MSVINVRVANLRKIGYEDLEKWTKDPRNLYVGRQIRIFIDKVYYLQPGSIFANKFSTKTHGREEAIRLYEAEILKQLQNPEFVAELRKLKGKNLGCWCSPEPCHADILLRIVSNLDEIRESKVQEGESKTQERESEIPDDLD